jgi:hypothetical protein
MAQFLPILQEEHLKLTVITEKEKQKISAEEAQKKNKQT